MADPTVPLVKNGWLDKIRMNNAEAQTRAQQITLVFDGDSIAESWTKSASSLWKERYEKLGAMRFGIVGDRTQNVLWRLQDGQMKNIQPKLVVLAVGKDNLLAGNTAAETADGIAAVVAEYRKLCPQAVILLQAVPPLGATPSDVLRTKTTAVNTEIGKLADGQKVYFLDWGSSLLKEDGSANPTMFEGPRYFSAKAYALLADALAPFIASHVATPGSPAK